MKRMQKARLNKGQPGPKGLTLIELLIVVAISAVILIALLSLYMAGQKYFFNQNARADTIEDSRVPMAWISRDIREATQVSDETVNVGSIDYETGPNCIVLDVPSLDESGNITAGTDTIIYARNEQNENRLQRVVVANGPGRHSGTRVMADDVNAFVLEFYIEDGSELETPTPYSETFIIDVTLSSTKRGIQRSGQPFVEALNTRVKLRNKTPPS